MMLPDIGAAGSAQEPMALYRALRRQGLLEPDAAQQLAVERLQSLYRALLDYRPESGLRGWLARLGLAEHNGAHAPMGLYLCGPVGRGKSMLMDLFFPRRRARRNGGCISMPSCSTCTTASSGNGGQTRASP